LKGRGRGRWERRAGWWVWERGSVVELTADFGAGDWGVAGKEKGLGWKRLVLDEQCERGYRDHEEVVVVDVRPWKGVQ